MKFDDVLTQVDAFLYYKPKDVVELTAMYTQLTLMLQQADEFTDDFRGHINRTVRRDVEIGNVRYLYKKKLRELMA